MAKVTSKLQLTLPKALAQRYGISPGDEITWVAAGESIRIVPATAGSRRLDVDVRLKLFDAATERQRAREATAAPPLRTGRAMTRDTLHRRGRAR